MALRRNRDQELPRVYRRHVDAVFAFFSYSVAPTAAEDLTSETFERVVRSWRRYDPRKASERTWILAIARNLLTDHFRRQEHRQAISTDEHPALLDELAAEGEPLQRVLSAAELMAWLSPLSPRDREVLALRYAADLSAAEVAEVMGLSEANVHQIVSRSLRLLRERAIAAGLRGSA